MVFINPQKVPRKKDQQYYNLIVDLEHCWRPLKLHQRYEVINCSIFAAISNKNRGVAVW